MRLHRGRVTSVPHGRAWEGGNPVAEEGRQLVERLAAPSSPSRPRPPPHRKPSAAPRLTKAIRGEAHLHLAPRPLLGGCTGAGGGHSVLQAPPPDPPPAQGRRCI